MVDTIFILRYFKYIMKTKTDPTLFIKELLSGLSKKQQEVVQKRYGLKDGQRRTLEEVGQGYGITRERIRQIEKSAFNQFENGETIEKLQPYFIILHNYIKDHGGLRHEEKLISEDTEDIFDISSRLRPAIIFFLLTLGRPFSRFVQDEYFHNLWSIGNNFYDQAKQLTDYLVEEFEKLQRPLPEDEFFYLVKKVVRENKSPFVTNEKTVHSYFDVSKKIEKNIYGEYGLADWPEIQPRGARERAYLVLKKIGKPIHFMELSKAVNSSGFSEKTNHFQTIHNELIKDPKFVLIGRGVYALKEWGYQPGTIIELLTSILKKSQPVSKEKLFESVKNQRAVKDSTIFMNLQNRKLFKQTPQGYILV